MRLTIAIPTYNRNQLLLENIRHLLPQITPDCDLLILDNCSPTPVEETLREIWSDFPGVEHEIIRHRANIGANANILRCFEKCQSEWIWIIGDDDTVQPDAVATIFRHIEAHPGALLLNFSYDGLRQASHATQGIEEFVEKLDPSANLPWVSASVYNAELMRANIKFGYQFAYSMLPHVAVLLVSIEASTRCYFSHEQIAAFERGEQPLEDQWSIVNMALGSPILFDLPFSSPVRRQLARKLLRTHAGESIRMHRYVNQLLLMAGNQADRASVLYYYDQICGRSQGLNSTWKRKLEMRLYRLVLRFPTVGQTLMARAYKLLKGRELHEVEGHKLQDRFNRM